MDVRQVLRMAGRSAVCLAVSLGMLAPASAQEAPAPSSPAGTPIIVTTPHPLAPGEKPSAWKRITGEHVVVYSDGSDDQLQRIAAHLERLHTLLARLYRAPGSEDEPPRLTVVLFDDAAQMRDLGLSNPRSEEGPYARPFVGERYYDPRVEGSVLALPRVDQVVPLDTDKAHIADCEDFLASNSGMDCLDRRRPPYHPPTSRTWEAILYGAYAQHMVVNYAPAIYPRWYIDGIGAFFSTVVFKGNGAIEYGRPPEYYRLVLRSYGRLNTAGVLNGDYLHNPSLRMDWTPYHAWLLTHYFVFSKLKGEQGTQFRHYMSDIARGQSMADAAAAFGTMKTVRYAVMGYAERPHEYATSPKEALPPPLPVEALSQPAADAMLAGLAPHPFAAAAR